MTCDSQSVRAGADLAFLLALCGPGHPPILGLNLIQTQQWLKESLGWKYNF